MANSPTLKKIEIFKRKQLYILLKQCNRKQQATFGKRYESVREIPEALIDLAIQQVERTLLKNKEKTKCQK